MLYEFAAIIEKEVKNFDFNDFVKFQYFLQGNINLSYSYSLQTYQSKESYVVMRHLNIVKSFLKFSHYENYEAIENVIDGKFEKNSYKNHTCPKFISISDMSKIFIYLASDKTISFETRLKYECIFRIMYESGARIGEVLGLTLEDFSLERREVDGQLVCSIKVRNRLSDSEVQCAKTCITIFDRKDYNLSTYKTLGPGFQIIVINEDLYRNIMDYFDSYCGRLQNDKKQPAIADIVENSQSSNYYIFGNEYSNTCLNKKILERYTRKMFIDLKIPVDEGNRFNNLFHRFRHGFVMNLLYEQKLTETEAIMFTRHTSTRSLAPYNNPTEDTIINSLEMIQVDYEKGLIDEESTI